MINLTLKGLPREVVALLKRRAAEHRRSMNAEALVLLEQGLRAAPLDPDALLARVDRVRERARGKPLAPSTIARWKAEGRE